jgi:hypothetical protein
MLMYLEIDEGYFEHPKTLDLCARLQDPNACVYPLRLWKWACRSAKSGKLGKISAFAIEKAVDYEPRDGKCFAALCSTPDRGGFIDLSEDGTAEIHDWMSYTGGAIARMDAKVKANKDRREAARKQHNAGTMPELCSHDAGRNSTQTRPDKTSQDKILETLPARDPSATTTEYAPRTKKPSGRDLLTWFGVERSKAFPETLPWVTGKNPDGDAQTFIDKIQDDAYQDVRPTMVAFFAHVKAGDQGWCTPKNTTDPSFAFGSWKSGFTALREEILGRSPKPKAVDRFGNTEQKHMRTPTADY